MYDYSEQVAQARTLLERCSATRLRQSLAKAIRETPGPGWQLLQVFASTLLEPGMSL
jgi:hypothetical protein